MTKMDMKKLDNFFRLRCIAPRTIQFPYNGTMADLQIYLQSNHTKFQLKCKLSMKAMMANVIVMKLETYQY